jgi:hypothetical protein
VQVYICIYHWYQKRCKCTRLHKLVILDNHFKEKLIIDPDMYDCMTVHTCHWYCVITMCCIVNITLIYMCLYGMYCIIGCVLWVTSGAASIWHDKTDDETHCPMVPYAVSLLADGQNLGSLWAQAFTQRGGEVAPLPMSFPHNPLQQIFKSLHHRPSAHVTTVLLVSFRTCG